MARTFLGRVAKDSIAPANKQFVDFVEESNSNPISLARNEQERLNYNVAQNLQQADQGLISPDRASVMAKSYFDAKQAPDMQTADLVDAYNRNRLEGSLQEEATLKRAGIDPNSTSTVKRIDAKTGDEYTTTTTRGAKQTNRADEGLDGTPTAYYGIGETTGPELMTKKKVQPKKSGSGRIVKQGYIAESEGKAVTYRDKRDSAIRDYMASNRAFTDNPKALSAAMSIIKSGFGSDADKVDKISKLEGVDIRTAQDMMDVLNGVDAEYTTAKVMTPDGTRELDVALSKDKLFPLKKYNSSGVLEPITELLGYTDKDDNQYYQVTDDKGEQVMISGEFASNNKELLTNTFAKYGYHMGTDEVEKMIEGEVKLHKGKAFVDSTGYKPTNTLQLFRATHKDTPSSIVARAEDVSATTDLYTDAADALEAGPKGLKTWGFDRYHKNPEDNDKEVHDEIVGQMLKMSTDKNGKPKNGTKFTTIKGKDGKLDTFQLVNNEVANATELSRAVDKPTMIKYKQENITKGNNTKVAATLPDGKSFSATTKIVPDANGNGLSVTFDGGSGKEYKIPYKTKPDYLDELIEQFYAEEIKGIYGSLPTNIASNQMVKTLKRRGK